MREEVLMQNYAHGKDVVDGRHHTHIHTVLLKSPQDQQLAGENLITPNSDLARERERERTHAKFVRRRMQLCVKSFGGARVYEYCSPDLLIIDAQTQKVT